MQERMTTAEYLAMVNPKPVARYSVALPTVVDGHRFPSGKEANRYRELYLLAKAASISHLQLQVTFPLVVNGVKIFPQGYRADFVYIEHSREGTKLVVEDSK